MPSVFLAERLFVSLPLLHATVCACQAYETEAESERERERARARERESEREREREYLERRTEDMTSGAEACVHNLIRVRAHTAFVTYEHTSAYVSIRQQIKCAHTWIYMHTHVLYAIHVVCM